MSGSTIVTSQEHAARTEVAYNLSDDMNGLAALFQLRKAWLAWLQPKKFDLVHRTVFLMRGVV